MGSCSSCNKQLIVHIFCIFPELFRGLAKILESNTVKMPIQGHLLMPISTIWEISGYFWDAKKGNSSDQIIGGLWSSATAARKGFNDRIKSILHCLMGFCCDHISLALPRGSMARLTGAVMSNGRPYSPFTLLSIPPEVDTTDITDEKAPD